MSEKNIPAFPYFKEIPEKKLDDVMTIFQPGMTLRDWFAGQAMAGLMMKYSLNQKHFEIGDMETVAKYSFMFADAMLARSAGKGE